MNQENLNESDLWKQKIESFIKKEFSSFYKSNPVNGPPRLDEREFGIGAFRQKISSRHLSFANPKELNEFLISQTPFYISSSVAYYSFPSLRPMESKEWNGSDLVFEFDADDLKTECSEDHTFWECPSCGKKGKGLAQQCDSCGSGLKVEEWVCPNCLDEVKKELFRLLEFLETDLGFTEKSQYSFNFSGSKGFHVHLRGKEIESLSPKSRVELVDYLTANGLEPESIGFYFNGKTMFCPKLSSAKGWQKILLNSLVEFIEQEKFSDLAAFSGLQTSKLKSFFSDKEKVLRDIDNGLLQPINGRKTNDSWNKILKGIAEEKKILLDRSTSIDASKIVRVPETLHGSTGLIAKNLSLNELREFNAFDEAIAFKEGTLKVKVKNTPKFYFNCGEWGPFEENSEVSLPKSIAVYLLLRGIAYEFIL